MRRMGRLYIYLRIYHQFKPNVGKYSSSIKHLVSILMFMTFMKGTLLTLTDIPPFFQRFFRTFFFHPLGCLKFLSNPRESTEQHPDIKIFGVALLNYRMWVFLQKKSCRKSHGRLVLPALNFKHLASMTSIFSQLPTSYDRCPTCDCLVARLLSKINTEAFTPKKKTLDVARRLMGQIFDGQHFFWDVGTTFHQ